MVTSKGNSPREKQQDKALVATRIYKEVSFDASHRLLHYEGKCRNLHGHRWRVEVWLAGEIDGRPASWWTSTSSGRSSSGSTTR